MDLLFTTLNVKNIGHAIGMRQCRRGKWPVWKWYHAKTKHFFHLITKLAEVAAKAIENSIFTEQIFYSNESKPECNKLMKSVSISGFILHVGEK